MSIESSELLRRLSDTLRNDIGPAVAEEFPRTQAYMAAVITQKVARQLELGPAHREAELADLAELMPGLRSALVDAPPAVSALVDAAEAQAEVAALGPLVEALYGWGLGQPGASEALSTIRTVLRRDIDRRMEVAA